MSETCRTLTDALREHVEWTEANEWEVPITLSDDLTSAANFIEELRDRLLSKKVDGNTSDGYHTFNELYHHRAILFSIIVNCYRVRAWKSLLHHDGTMYDGMFIVGIDTPMGQATYHYDIEPYWEMFKCIELEKAPEWDGHTPAEAIVRLASLRNLDVVSQAVLDQVRWERDIAIEQLAELGYSLGQIIDDGK